MSTSTTTERLYNFSAGPSLLPEPVLEQIQTDVWNIRESGIGILEHSHRGSIADDLFEEVEAKCRTIGNISDDYAVLFLQGGASMQFSMIPMSYLPEDGTADYPDTGEWTGKAIEDAKYFGTVNVAFEGSACSYDHTPADEELSLTPGAAYLHYCSNNTVMGTRYSVPPTTDAPLVCDASSDFFARPLDFNAHMIVYGGAQKNLGPSGVAMVIIRRDVLDKACRTLPSMLDYARHAKAGSRLNTPPVFGVYCMNLVFQWILDCGGVGPVNERNTMKAKLIYDAIDHSNGFYRGHSQLQCRSEMNITFKLGDPELEKRFLTEAAEHAMTNLKGHRAIGGMRASIYNAFPVKGCETLASFMDDFAARNG
jgi:phosphoserine aminotransferase